MADAAPFAVITGANRGLGLRTSQDLAARGWRLGISSRDPDHGRRAAEGLRGVGADVQFIPLNVADAESVRDFVSRARAEWPPIDALVNNAGVSLSGFDGPVAERTMATNFYGPLRLTDELADRLASPANVVMVSSGMGELAGLPSELRASFANPALTRKGLIELVERFVREVKDGSYRRSGWPTNAYRVSKVALNALTRILSKELAPRHVHVNAICPGWVRTDMGGSSAPRSIERGAEGIVWGATLAPNGPTGTFFRDGRAIEW
jgi:NAD(P)-dependent dehydrogenase (short-subunit alcohol dehydrogenase family)